MRQFEISAVNSKLATFAGHASAIWEVQFEKEKSDNLYTCSEDGQLLMWNGAALSGLIFHCLLS